MVRFIGATENHGPVAVNPAAVIARNDLVKIVSGLVVAVTDAAVANLAVALDPFPDAEYEEGSTAKPAVQLALLGENCEVELPFTGATALTQAMVGASYNILAASGGSVNLALATTPAFHIRRLGDGTAIGDTSGTLIGVFLDSVSF